MGCLRLLIQKDSHLEYSQVVVGHDFQVLQLLAYYFWTILMVNFPLSWVMF